MENTHFREYRMFGEAVRGNVISLCYSVRLMSRAVEDGESDRASIEAEIGRSIFFTYTLEFTSLVEGQYRPHFRLLPSLFFNSHWIACVT